jgi:hypothetical protein
MTTMMILMKRRTLLYCRRFIAHSGLASTTRFPLRHLECLYSCIVSVLKRLACTGTVITPVSRVEGSTAVVVPWCDPSGALHRFACVSSREVVERRLWLPKLLHSIPTLGFMVSRTIELVRAQRLKGKCWMFYMGKTTRSRKSSLAEEAALSRIRKPQCHRFH